MAASAAAVDVRDALVLFISDSDRGVVSDRIVQGWVMVLKTIILLHFKISVWIHRWNRHVALLARAYRFTLPQIRVVIFLRANLVWLHRAIVRVWEEHLIATLTKLDYLAREGWVLLGQVSISAPLILALTIRRALVFLYRSTADQDWAVVCVLVRASRWLNLLSRRLVVVRASLFA